MLLALALLLVPAAQAAYDYVPERYREMFAEEVERAGMEGYAPLIAAQIKHESNWDENAESGAGAKGLAQFVDETLGDIEPRLGEDCAGKGPFDARCSIRAQCQYVKDLLRFVYATRGATRPTTTVDAYQLVLASYNAGLGRIRSERLECYGVSRCRSGVWLDNVEEHCLRADRYCDETRHYVGRITNSALSAFLTGGP